MKKFLSILAAIALMLVGVGSVYGIERLDDTLNNQEVLVLAKDIAFKEKIEKGDLAVKSVPVEQIINDAYRPEDTEMVVGNRAAISMKKGMQLHRALIDTHDLVPDSSEGEFVAPIPDEWLFAVPGTLRRSYVADFYAISNQGQDLLKEIEGDGDEKLEDLKEEDLQAQVTTNMEPFLENVRVAHVRDRNNQEVVTSTNEESETTTSSGVVTNIEIIANDQTLADIQKKVQDGKQIYIVYRYKTIEDAESSEKEQKTDENDEGTEE